MTMHTPPPDTDELDSDPSDESSPACILVFNASDPSGAGGLTGDIATIASVGGHAIAVVTGAYARDTAQIFDHFCLDDEAVAEQARAVLEDLPVQAIKVGFVGSTENISTIAEIATDYDDVPVIAYMPNLSWWREELIDEYLDAFRELLLPQTSVLVETTARCGAGCCPTGAATAAPPPATLPARLPRWACPYTLVTGIPLPEQFVETCWPRPRPSWAATSLNCSMPPSPARATPCRPRSRPWWAAATTWAKPPAKR